MVALLRDEEAQHKKHAQEEPPFSEIDMLVVSSASSTREAAGYDQVICIDWLQITLPCQ